MPNSALIKSHCMVCDKDFEYIKSRGGSIRRLCSDACRRKRSAQRVKLFQERNPGRTNEIKKAWVERNPEKMDAARKNWRKNNPDKVKFTKHERKRKRRATLRNSNVTSFTLDEMRDRLALFGNKCWMCGGFADTVDHVKPLCAGGPHMLSNLRPACRDCNLSKHGDWPVQTSPAFKFTKKQKEAL